MSSVRGFILQPTYRITAGKPVIHLWGKLETEETFLIRERRLVPHFFIRASDVEAARRLGARWIRTSDRVTPSGEPVARVELARPSDTPELRGRLQRGGVRCFEADVRFAMRYLIDHGIRGALAIRGEAAPGHGVDRVFDNPGVRPADWKPALSVLSFDIETDPRARRVLSVALCGGGVSEVLLLTPEGASTPAGAVAVASERDLLRRFAERVRAIDPDVLTGWNIDEFDFPVLLRRAAELRVPLTLGRGPGATRSLPGRGPRARTLISIPGRLVLDGVQLLLGASIRMERYSLDFVAREITGEGKMPVTSPGEDRGLRIQSMFETDRERFVAYNLTDARLVTAILKRLQLVELAVERSRLTGLPPDRVAGSVAAFDFLYLSELGRRGIVAPSVSISDEPPAATGGGHVFTPEAGLYRNVLLFDVKSLYPSLIRTFQIDPLGYVARPAPGDDLIIAPNGAAFRRQPSILAGLLDRLFPAREEASAAGDRTASYAIKILMNSFFGVLGAPICRFYNPRVADAITSFGRELLIWSRDWIEAGGRRVLYGDTDSLFVDSGLDDPAAAHELGESLLDDLNQSLGEHVRRKWRVEPCLEMELERLYLKLFLPPARRGAQGARKRYAGLVRRRGREEVVFTGLEVVRRDWTDLAREVQRELYERLFRDQPVAAYLRDVVENLRAGRLDEGLVYRRRLRKPIEAYTATTPPHVAAARKLGKRPGRVVRYVVTTDGPEPVAERRHPLDYEHYIARQLRPVAEPVLAWLELDFGKVVGDDRQMELFEG